MAKSELIKQWQIEENFTFQGWDFSHIDGRWDYPNPPWDYPKIVKSYLEKTDVLLDMGTGGGEVLLSLKHSNENTFATESYAPNFELCKEKLSPLGITVVQTYNDDKLPFENEFFDIIINRHESFDLSEVNRTLKRGGYFITQQVGNKNSYDFAQKLFENFTPHSNSHSIENYTKTLTDFGYQIIQAEDVKFPVKFFDTGAFVYYAKIIVWEFPNFSVKTHLDKLFECQKEVEKHGFLQGTGHRFLIVAKKT